MAAPAQVVDALPSSAPAPERTLLIACGALAREIVELIRVNDWQHMTVSCLPAAWHNTPAKIPAGVRQRISDARGRYDRILALYGHCGTGRLLHQVLASESVARLKVPHCPSFLTDGGGSDELAYTREWTIYL